MSTACRAAMSLALALALMASPTMASVAVDPWLDLGFGLTGTHGSPVLTGEGPLLGSTTVTLTLDNVLADTTAWLVIGLARIDAPFAGGTLVPAPDVLIPIPTGGSSGVPSSVVLADTFPLGLPHGTELHFQFWIEDEAGAAGFAASHALKASTSTAYELISEDFDALLVAAQEPSVSKKIYTTQDFTTQSFVRSPDCWAASVDLTGLSPWNQAYGKLRAGTLVSPRHIVFAEHYKLSTTPGNNEIVFVTADDLTVRRNLISVSYPAVDIGVGLLDADVPAEIGFHKVLPQDWAQHLPVTFQLPLLVLDQQEKALVREVVSLTENSSYCPHTNSSDPLRILFNETLIGGDSGNPGFLLIDGEAVLMLTHHFSTSGPFYTFWFDEVNAAMTALGGGYQLTEFEFGTAYHE